MRSNRRRYGRQAKAEKCWVVVRGFEREGWSYPPGVLLAQSTIKTWKLNKRATHVLLTGPNPALVDCNEAPEKSQQVGFLVGVKSPSFSISPGESPEILEGEEVEGVAPVYIIEDRMVLVEGADNKEAWCSNISTGSLIEGELDTVLDSAQLDKSAITTRGMIESTARQYADEFAQLLQSNGSKVRSGLKEGDELDDLVSVFTDGRCWSKEEETFTGSIDICSVLDVSGSTRGSQPDRIRAISQLGYFLNRLSKCTKLIRNETFLFARDVMKLPDRSHGLLPLAFNYPSSDRHDMLTPQIFRKTGGSTSLFSAIDIALAHFKPRDRGLMVVVTDFGPNDLSYNDEVIRKNNVQGTEGGYPTLTQVLDSFEIPEQVVPILIQVSQRLGVSKRGKWLNISLTHKVQGSELINVVVAELFDKIASFAIM